MSTWKNNNTLRFTEAVESQRPSDEEIIERVKNAANQVYEKGWGLNREKLTKREMVERIFTKKFTEFTREDAEKINETSKDEYKVFRVANYNTTNINDLYFEGDDPASQEFTKILEEAWANKDKETPLKNVYGVPEYEKIYSKDWYGVSYMGLPLEAKRIILSRYTSRIIPCNTLYGAYKNSWSSADPDQTPVVQMKRIIFDEEGRPVEIKNASKYPEVYTNTCLWDMKRGEFGDPKTYKNRRDRDRELLKNLFVRRER